MIAIAPPVVSNTSNDVDITINDIIDDINCLLNVKVSKNMLKTVHGLSYWSYVDGKNRR